MKHHIKKRTTFVCGDSSIRQQHICTFDNFVQLLLYVEEETLKKMIMLANYYKNPVPSNAHIFSEQELYYNYIEVQIHGDVYINKDIGHVRIHQSQMDNNVINRLKEFDIPFSIFT
jgi:hypothetical protein